MRIVVTGATGNIGTALLRRLAEEGTHELVGVARRPPDLGVLPRTRAAGVSGRVTWTAADLTDPRCVPILQETFVGADAVVCEVRDGGHIDAPLVGRERPSLERPGGRGLWLVNQLCDLVQIRSFPTGTVVRLHMRLR